MCLGVCGGISDAQLMSTVWDCCQGIALPMFRYENISLGVLECMSICN